MNYAKRPSSMLEQGWACKTVLTIDVVVVVDVDVEKFPVHIGRGQIVRVNYLSDHTHDKAIRKWQPSKLICTHPPHHVQIQKGKNQASKKVSKQASTLDMSSMALRNHRHAKGWRQTIGVGNALVDTSARSSQY
jgi:hypothetical protein